MQSTKQSAVYTDGADSPANLQPLSEYALKLRCEINEALSGLRCNRLPLDKPEDILRRYLAFIQDNGRAPNQHSVEERSLYQK